MTLDEAIVHAKELSENQSVCNDCREEHKQLAGWLEELKEYKSKKCETSACEMFESLGYTRTVESEELIYTYNSKDAFHCVEITFNLSKKEIEIYDNYEAYTINNDLLRAIDKQAEELGWLEEKTCTNESEYNLVDGFECSNCGIIIENYNEIEIDEDYPEDRCMKEYAPKYCPNCGRKIVEEKEDER